MTYFDLVSSHIKRNGGDSARIAAVADYLENPHPEDERPWSQEFDDVCQAAVAYANSKQERLRKHKRVAKAKSPGLNGRHRQSTRSLIAPSTGSKVTSFVIPATIMGPAFCRIAAWCQRELRPL